MIKFREWLREKEAERNKGIYVSVKYTQSVDEDIKYFCDKNKIPNPIP